MIARWPEFSIQGHGQGFHRPADCCSSYSSRKIRCVFMESYFETTGSCSRPAVIFITKKGKKVCADPRDEGVQNCTMNLRHTLGGSLRNILLAKYR
ncbi:PREDICTED: C-C motif chemokine 15-like [Hipposideros armiger]|uniref:C-C motif chemokine 15-like n=1 Tax=Hipposideros armiger TaxID=186990 RepID=A0A8B7QWK9_HIPAR|nr:PREDICTED: C-C motif chemokine 15-like [Hipposideros armiger]